ncbi:MAG TPA: helicase-related protein [Bryobacteraceae bacterium]|nr:helicase-related protein [Bryobacteraceae bacterium]
MATIPRNIGDYLQRFANELGERVVAKYPPLYQPGDPVLPALARLRRRPFPAQTLAIMGVCRRMDESRSAAVIAECGTGKTLVALASVFAHARGKPFTAIFMVPPQLVEKTCRECSLTLPGVRVFIIDGLRNGVASNGHTGVNEVRFRNGRIVRDGLKTSLSDMRLAKGHRSARHRWQSICGGPSIFVISRERAKLGTHWRHVYRLPQSGPYLGNVVNADTGLPVLTGEDQLRRGDFRKAKHSEMVCPEETDKPGRGRRPFFSALWQADNQKIHRAAPIEFIGRRLKNFFDYAIADEVHELKGGETAQGNALGTLASCAKHTLILTGTLLGGYADELFHILFRLDPRKMLAEGFEYGETGLRAFTETYGVLEKVTTIEPADNACSEARVTKRVKRRPGASPLLFGRFLMDLGAFVSLEDISDALPSYTEEVIGVEMDPQLKRAYEELEEDIKDALKEHWGNPSVLSTAMNALLLYPDRPFRLGDLIGYATNPDTNEREKFLISRPADLDEEFVYAKERRLLQEIQSELSRGRLCQVFAVYTQKRDVTQRLKSLLAREGIRVEVLTADVPPEQREAWYERQLRNGMQVCICHPKIVQTGLDLVFANSIFFVQSGYSTYVLRQASRRSWRIGQKKPVRVVYFHYANTAQESCLRLMGKKMLVSLALEGKFVADGIQALEDDDDMLTSMARDLVTQRGVGERADAIWKELQAQRPTTFTEPVPLVPEPTAAESELEPLSPIAVEEIPNLPPANEVAPGEAFQTLARFGASMRRTARRPASPNEGQLSLAF